MSVGICLFLYIFFVGLSFYFSGMEVSLFYLRKLPEKVKAVESYIQKYERYFEHYLTLCLFGNIFSGIAVSHITFFLCSRWFGLESSGTWVEGIFCVMTVGILFYVGEVIPKIVIQKSVVRFLRNTQHLLKFFSVVFYPAILFIQIFNNILFNRLGRLQDQSRYILSREDLRNCFQEGLEVSGKLGSRQARFFSLATALSNIKASEAMVPLVDFESFDEDMSTEKVVGLLRTKGYTKGVEYIILYKNRVDAISGYVLILDLLEREEKNKKGEKIKVLSKKPVYLPNTNTLESIIQQFWKEKLGEVTVLVDEYGGCCGIIDRASIIRKIFGISYKNMTSGLQENGSKGKEMIKSVGPFSYEVDTLFDIDDLNIYLGISLPKQGGYDTLAGLINAHCERILPQGSKFEIDGIHCTVITSSPTSVDRVLLELPKATIV